MIMKPPAQIKPYLSTDELAVWVRESPTREAYKMRLAIWLTHIRSYHAHEVADMLQISKQAVWLWVSQYNRNGPESLERKGRGGRRWAFLTWAEEESLLNSLEERALRGEVLTVKQVIPEVRKAVGKDVTLHYVYKLLRRHNWRKLGPRPRHVKADREEQESFKKTTRKSSKRH
jgi:transposase